MGEGVVEQRDEEFRGVSGRDEGEAGLGDCAHLVESAILHRVLRGHDVVAEIAAQTFPVHLYVKWQVPGL